MPLSSVPPLGAHLSSARGLTAMGRDALSIGANTFQFFARNPRGARAKTRSEEDVSGLRVVLQEHGFAPILAHAPYTLNPCAADEEKRSLAVRMLREDLELMEQLPGNYYNLHPGSRLTQTREEAVRRAARTLDEAMFPGQKSLVLLETMAGKGSELGASFEELRMILDLCRQPEDLGICLDTCHLWDAGYDVRDRLDEVLEALDRAVGLSLVKAVHLNDSLNPLGSHKDRHANIGRGALGLEGALTVLRHPALRGLPFILETPADLKGHGAELRLLKTSL